jgi:hypothetical protein
VPADPRIGSRSRTLKRLRCDGSRKKIGPERCPHRCLVITVTSSPRRPCDYVVSGPIQVTTPIPPTPQRHLGVEGCKLRHQLAWPPGERLPGVLFFSLSATAKRTALGQEELPRGSGGRFAIPSRVPKELKHHYIPVFYLKRWAVNRGRLIEYGRQGKHKFVTARPTSPKGTGYVRGLNTIPDAPPEVSEWLEAAFLAMVDDWAARALAAFVEVDRQPSSRLPFCLGYRII